MLGFTGKNILRRPMQNTNLIVNLNLSPIKNRTVSYFPLSAPQKCFPLDILCPSKKKFFVSCFVRGVCLVFLLLFSCIWNVIVCLSYMDCLRNIILRHLISDEKWGIMRWEVCHREGWRLDCKSFMLQYTQKFLPKLLKINRRVEERIPLRTVSNCVTLQTISIKRRCYV